MAAANTPLSADGTPRTYTRDQQGEEDRIWDTAAAAQASLDRGEMEELAADIAAEGGDGGDG
jgi:hypothetical protein